MYVHACASVCVCVEVCVRVWCVRSSARVCVDGGIGEIEEVDINTCFNLVPVKFFGYTVNTRFSLHSTAVNMTPTNSHPH